ncbi:hypothetical protein Egran_05905 [Elaphomyces granulatus]|uniref:ZZ-type domain-containing protein n=1 Tax=Elaphomyces granulatus TaxID=519963 RepID=A0A232LRA4_9EURO|nr:hypothetical protein Egran_05905 [Elaphomyces granulatus]
MAVPAHMAVPVGPVTTVGLDTIITVKVLYNDANRRFKLPLRDLGARSLPQKLHQLLNIPADANVVFERYSDSAAGYIRLESDNQAVYKQLYRAAKAKQKLRIKVTTVSPSVVVSKPIAESTEADQEAAEPKESSPRYSYLDTVLSPPLPSAPMEKLSNISSSAPEVTVEQIKSAGASDVICRLRRVVQDRHAPASPPSAQEAPCPSFCIDCNSCGRSIPNEHYHCGTCDGGDYDLCPSCVDRGVSCLVEDHWLIKRFVEGESVINSTTVRLASRRNQSEDESASTGTATVSVPEVDSSSVPETASESVTLTAPALEQETDAARTPLPTKMPEVETAVPSIPAVPDPPVEVTERCCNACFREFDEIKMVTCSDCEDYDLCLTCLLKDAHGHHPGHAFSLIHDGKLYLKHLVLSRCRPGRHHQHAAICDGCDKRIIGVRHKCLACPDWDYCWSCIKDAPRTHPGHRFVPIYGAIAEHPVHNEIHRGIFCDGPLCKIKRIPAYITGVRYKCAVCYDTDFCEACEALPTNPHNPTHPLIKFKSSIQGVTVTTYNDSGLGGQVVTLGDGPAPVPAPAPVLAPAQEPVLTPTEEHTAKSVSNNASPPDQPERQTEEVMRTELRELAEEFTKMVDENVEKERQQQPPDFENADNETKSAVMMASARASGYQAFFIRETVPDGTKFLPNHVFQQTWTLYNPGPLPWIPGSSVRFVGGDSMFNVDTDRPSSISSITAAMESNVLSDLVMPGEKADFSVTLKTPQREGTAISYWRLKNPDGIPFGHKLWCDIQVRMDAAESAKDEPAESASENTIEIKEPQDQRAQSDVKQELQLTDSVMVFPKLEKESPLSRSEVALSDPVPVAPSAPSLSNMDEQDILEDVESLALEDVDSADGFLTDEEYDILDASDQEFFNTRGSQQ